MSRFDEVQEALRAMDRRDGQPCLGCAHSPACADMELACRPFNQWVQLGTAPSQDLARAPSRRHFLAAFKGGDP